SIPHHRHRPLPDSSRYIRLLRWRGRRRHNASPIQVFTTKAVPLSSLNHLDYAALSYTWKKHPGTASRQPRSQKVYLDGNILPVQENLWDFITSSPGNRLLEQHSLWFIDAICVDQSSDTEKGNQLRLMPEIFDKASKTVVWLGKDDRSHIARAAQL
ncbi:heterokaryon incompatibility protein-domain-containing protein, partial [Microdochium bolleyi]